jgi:hypothetical protein
MAYAKLLDQPSDYERLGIKQGEVLMVILCSCLYFIQK